MPAGAVESEPALWPWGALHQPGLWKAGHLPHVPCISFVSLSHAASCIIATVRSWQVLPRGGTGSGSRPKQEEEVRQLDYKGQEEAGKVGASELKGISRLGREDSSGRWAAPLWEMNGDRWSPHGRLREILSHLFLASPVQVARRAEEAPAARPTSSGTDIGLTH